MNIICNSKVSFKHVDSVSVLNRGDVVINGFHDPMNLKHTCGVYLVIDQDNVFVVNLQSMRCYTRTAFKKHMEEHGMYLMNAELTVAPMLV